MSLMIGNKSVVSMHYTLTNDAGEVLDSSAGKEPLKYLHGANNIIPGLESALIGKVEGDALQVSIEPADAYGELDESLVQTVPATAFQGVDEIKPGMTFEAQSPQGQVHHVTIKAVEGDEVTIDGNHPLAGVKLHFDVEIVEVREATESEMEHGHVH